MKLVYPLKPDSPYEYDEHNNLWRVLYNPEYVENTYTTVNEAGETEETIDNYWIYDVVVIDGNGIEYITLPTLIEALIAKRYTQGEEIALNRQRDTKPEEWKEYYDYCEECKRIAKEIIDKHGK